MQKEKKQQILNIVKSLKKMHEILEKQEGKQSQDELVNCQESAIVIGRAIEKTEGEGTDAVRLLEEYCEKVYEKSIGQGQGDSQCNVEIDKQIVVLLEQIQECIDKIPLTHEIVFLPYKYSMWDCMESIWMAAKEDKRCKCRVIPIPYYECETGGGIRYCYEGDKFPEDADIIDYREYDLQTEKPDVIFVHNPYDNCNYVTQIEPAYFSDNLISNTGMLVYVPYYIAGSYDKSGAWFKMAAELPVMRNADRIVVQAEAQKKAMAAAGITEEKLLLLGQPKFDKSVSLKREEYLRTSKWSRIIENKKVFLLNSSIEFLLGDTLHWFQIIDDVIKTVLNMENVVLLWRPHPLLEATIRSMRPDIYDRYLDLKDTMGATEKIIVDETKDAYEAMALSDALISDYSSIIFQYIATQKPVYIINGDKSSKERAIVTCDYYESYMEAEMKLEEFVKLIVDGEDPKAELRYRTMANSVVNMDGTAGEKVFHHIMGELESREN